MNATTEVGPTVGDWQPGDRIFWRRPTERIWKKGNVRRVYNDKHGSVSLYDKYGLHVTVPDTEDCIKERE